MKRKPTRRRSSRSSVSILSPRYIFILLGIFALIVFLRHIVNKQNVLGVKYLAQETMPNPQSGEAPPSQQAPQQPESQPQQAPPESQQMSPQMQQQMQQFQQMSPEQQRQYGIQQMSPEQREQNRLYEQMSPEQQQEYNRKINEQIKQRYGGQTDQQQTQPPQNTSRSNTTTTTNTNSNPPSGPNSYQPLTVEQQRQMYQQSSTYQNATAEQKKQMDEMFEKTKQQTQRQYQQVQQQWQQEAAKNGFRISDVQSEQYQQYLFQGKTNAANQTNNASQITSGFQTLPPSSVFPTIQGSFFVQGVGAGNRSNIDLNDASTKVQLAAQNANLSLKAVKEDGTEIELHDDAFEKIASAIKLETGSEISQKDDTFIMKRGDVEASTTLPLSFNIVTKTFTIETSKGEQELEVLPDEAVQKMLSNHEVNSVTKKGSTSPVILTQFNNRPVYQIEGTNTKRMFGFFPIAIPKTSYVSAQNGNVVSSNQTLSSRILNAISR